MGSCLRPRDQTAVRRLVLALALSTLALSPRSARAQEPPVPADGSESWQERLYSDVRSAVVRVESLGGTGTGFVLEEPDLVATAFHVIDTGRPVRLRLPDGGHVRATVVAVDRRHDLALLRTSTPIDGARVLALADDDAPAVGMRVAVIGHPYGTDADHSRPLRGLLNWSLTGGVVSAVGEEALQTDAASNPGSSGSPLLDERGRVLGVITSGVGTGIAFATRSSRLRELLEGGDEQEPYRGRVATNLSAGFALQVDRTGAFPGFSIGLGLTIRDRWALNARLGWFSWTENVSGGGAFERQETRMSLQLDAEHRFGFAVRSVPLYLTLGAGVALQRERVSERRLQIGLDDPGCDLATAVCTTSTFVATDHDDHLSIHPVLRVAFLVADRIELSYSVQLDVLHPRDTVHVIGLGLRF